MSESLQGSAEVFRTLRNYERDLYKELRKNVNSNLTPIIQPIEAIINSQITGQLKQTTPGMFHNGRSAWAGAKIRVKQSLRKKDLIFIEGTGRSGGVDNQVGFEYAELAGIERRPPRPVSKGWGETTVGYHSYIYNGQGKAFNRNLTRNYGGPGRFLWKRVMERKGRLETQVLNISERFNLGVNRRLR